MNGRVIDGTLLIETPRGNLSQIMAHINGAYTTYVNVKRQRAGHLFQGRYKAILVEKEEYALELSRYLHLNPVRAKMVARPEEYPWSSYRAYVGLSPSPEWLQREWILGHFGPTEPKAWERYRDFVERTADEARPSPFEEVVGSAVLGSKGFLSWVQTEFLEQKPTDRELPALRQIVGKPALEEIRRAAEVKFAADRRTARRVALYLCRRYSGRKLREIGQQFGLGESGVTEASRRVAKELESNRLLQEAVEDVERGLDL